MARRSARPRSQEQSLPKPGVYSIDTGILTLAVEAGPPRHWSLELNGFPASIACPDDPSWLGFEYLDVIRAALSVTHPDQSLTALHLGAAACALPWALEVERPGSRQVAVELDAKLAALVREWFPLPRSPALRIRVGDAAEQVSTFAAGSLDAVVRDVFIGDTTPTAVSDQTFIKHVRQTLNETGVYLANIADRPPLGLVWDEVVTAASVFPVVAVIAETQVLRGRRYGNTILLAQNRPLPVPELQRALGRTGVSLRLVHGERLTQLAASGRIRSVAKG